MTSDGTGRRRREVPAVASDDIDLGLAMIERSTEVDGLLGFVIDEIDRRLETLPAEAISNRSGGARVADRDDVQALVRFSTRAAAAKARAEWVERLRARADRLGADNRRLSAWLATTEAARRRVDALLDAVDAGIVVIGADGVVLEANRTARRLLGAGVEDDLVGRRAPVELTQLVEAADAGGGPAEGFEVRVPKRDGAVTLVTTCRRVAGDDGDWVLAFHDVTSRDARIAEAHRRDRTVDLLRAAAVLAHKINNPLTTLMGRAQLLRMAPASAEASAASGAIIEESGKRIATLVRELADVAKTGDIDGLEHALRMTEAGGVNGRESDG